MISKKEDPPSPPPSSKTTDGQRKATEGRSKNIKELLDAILLLKNYGEAKKFLRDLLTDGELIEFGNRWKAARMLSKNISYVEVEKETGLSSTTVARVSKWLNKGKGGYKLMLNKINHHHNLSPSGKRLR